MSLELFSILCLQALYFISFFIPCFQKNKILKRYKNKIIKTIYIFMVLPFHYLSAITGMNKNKFFAEQLPEIKISIC